VIAILFCRFFFCFALRVIFLGETCHGVLLQHGGVSAEEEHNTARRGGVVLSLQEVAHISFAAGGPGLRQGDLERRCGGHRLWTHIGKQDAS
jgi:hypothetical protein